MSESRIPRGARRGPAPADWALLAISVVFCALALLIFPSNWRLAVTTLALFGGCGAVAVMIIRRKLREQHFVASATHVAVAGGVELRAGRRFPLRVGAGLAVVGLVIALVDPSSPWLIRACGGFMAVVGVGVLIAGIAGRLTAQYLRFEDAGFVLGRAAYAARIPWDGLQEVAEFEFANNACVGLRLLDAARVSVTPESARPRFVKELVRTQRQYGLDVVLMVAHYGVDAPPLAAAILRYARDPAARVELATVPDARRIGGARSP